MFFGRHEKSLLRFFSLRRRRAFGRPPKHTGARASPEYSASAVCDYSSTSTGWMVMGRSADEGVQVPVALCSPTNR